MIACVGLRHTDGLDALNAALERRWRVLKATPSLNEYGDVHTPFLAALVILECPRRDEPLAVKARKKIHTMEDEPKDAVEKVIEENGADAR